jgi:prepilin-type N-terminal cleavage/methylation domain-containing protein
MVFGKSSTKRGFTLVEMAVVLVLFGVLVMFAAGMLAPLLRSEITTTQKRDLEKAMNRLVQRIKMSFYDVPLFANLNWDQSKDNDASPTTFYGFSADNYSFTLGRAKLLYSSGYPVYDSNGKGFWLYSGIPIKRGYFSEKAKSVSFSTLGTLVNADYKLEYIPDWFEFSRKVCEHTEATITVKECLTKECTGDNVSVTEDVAFLITTPNLTPKVEYPVNKPCGPWPDGPKADIWSAYDDCPGGVNNKRTFTIPFTERYDSAFKLITLGRLRDEVGCNAGHIIPRNYSPPTVSSTSDAWYVPEGYSGRVALTFATSNGWPMYWCMEWEHEWGKIYRNSATIDERAPQSAPTRIAGNNNLCLSGNTFYRTLCNKDVVTMDHLEYNTTLHELGTYPDTSKGESSTNIRGYCTRKANGIGDVNPKFISFGDSQLIHVVMANLLGAALYYGVSMPTEYTSFTNDHGPYAEYTVDWVRLNSRGVYHLNLYISDRPDMSKIIDQVNLNLVY